jgi:hypothetical protein
MKIISLKLFDQEVIELVIYYLVKVEITPNDVVTLLCSDRLYFSLLFIHFYSEWLQEFKLFFFVVLF